ncbi:hypothetical protein Tco_0020504 [Tanacetum coccineum]
MSALLLCSGRFLALVLQLQIGYDIVKLSDHGQKKTASSKQQKCLPLPYKMMTETSGFWSSEDKARGNSLKKESDSALWRVGLFRYKVNTNGLVVSSWMISKEVYDDIFAGGHMLSTTYLKVMLRKVFAAGEDLDEDTRMIMMSRSPTRQLIRQCLEPISFRCSKMQTLPLKLNQINMTTSCIVLMTETGMYLPRPRHFRYQSIRLSKVSLLPLKQCPTNNTCYHWRASKCWGENVTPTVTEEPPSHTEGEIKDTEKKKSPKRIDKGMKIATDDVESPVKLVPTSRVVRVDPDEPVSVPYMINGKMHYLTNDEITKHLEKEELIKKATEQARLLAITKPEVVKVVHEEAEKLELILKELPMQRKYNFDELREIIPIKKNVVVKDLMNSLSRRYERIKKIPKELGIQSALPAPILEQASSKSLGRKRKHVELEPKIKVPGLGYDRSLPEGVPFVNNMVIEEPKYGIFFTDMFGGQAFQKWNDIHKVGVDSLVSYLVMASMIKTPENARFCLKLKKLIVEHPHQEKLKSKKVKLEALGYKLDLVLLLYFFLSFVIDDRSLKRLMKYF